MKHAKGNLIDLAENGEFDVIVHGANCFNTMGGGIAREIRDRYPEAAVVDSATIKGDYNKLGNYTVMLGKQFNIINAYTQYNMSMGEDVFEYASFAVILQKLAHEYPTVKFGFPYIGTGLAGGDKDTIMALIEDFADRIHLTGGEVTLVEFG